MIDLTFILKIALPVITAVSGLWEAKQAGETISYPLFIKTLFVGFVTAGLISQTNVDLLTQIATVQLVTLALDKGLNALMNKFKRTQ